MSVRCLVVDSSPLIALARLDLLALPNRIFGETLVTATVWQEVLRAPSYYLSRPLVERRSDRLLYQAQLAPDDDLRLKVVRKTQAQ